MNKWFRTAALTVQRLLAGQDSLARGPERDFEAQARCPIFIVGAPRTGSTLLFQLLVKHLQVAYISNVMAAMPRTMVRAARATARWMRRPRELRESDLGYTPGLLSPNEGGAVMQAWFREELGPEERKLVRNTVVLLSEILGGALVTKNLANSLRLASIARVFPEARFLHIQRDPMFTAQSLLLSRRRYHGSDEAWFSVEPTGRVDVQSRPPLYQVLWQATTLDRMVAEFLAASPAASMVVSYERLCAHPAAMLDRIADEFGLACRPGPRPHAMALRDQVRLGATEWAELERYQRELDTELSAGAPRV